MGRRRDGRRGGAGEGQSSGSTLVSRGDSECSLERRSWIERDTPGRDIGAGKRENKGERRETRREESWRTRLRQRYVLVVPAAPLSRVRASERSCTLARNVPTRRTAGDTEGRRRKGRWTEGKEREARAGRRRSERQDEPRPKRILEVKIERVSGELLLLSDSSTVVCVTGVFVPGRLK